jgi:hypothetical protein
VDGGEEAKVPLNAPLALPFAVAARAVIHVHAPIDRDAAS